eukprot:CAMPEP_0115850640 /NCGR_PEP_ID=MMETSP0287-20121206/12071_1 /TAXON_ID=412157 /ORGANISM="Chrysochromulina rotalis, Strain UIO044" /LENGTH=153 /DNA_ID=CAMNT_0003304649 /DNA_START=168 /DNA_END=626 /DNA_ORIENTATION=+
MTVLQCCCVRNQKKVAESLLQGRQQWVPEIYNRNARSVHTPDGRIREEARFRALLAPGLCHVVARLLATLCCEAPAVEGLATTCGGISSAIWCLHEASLELHLLYELFTCGKRELQLDSTPHDHQLVAEVEHGQHDGQLILPSKLLKRGEFNW